MIENILEPYISERFRNDEKYRNGHIRIINPLPGMEIMGLHIPDMKAVARSLASTQSPETLIAEFESSAESLKYEEVMVWGFVLNKVKIPLERRLEHLQKFVEIIDNWAVCDSFCSDSKWADRLKGEDRDRLWALLDGYFASHKEFEVRFAVVFSMCHFLNEEWLDKVFERIRSIDFGKISSEYKDLKPPYYVRMGVAWLLATALAKFPDRTRAFANTSPCPEDVLKLYVRKARESFRTRDVSPF